MEQLLSMAKKAAEQAEVFHLSTTETPVRFEANKIRTILSRQESLTALRLVKGGKIGYATARGRLDRKDLLAKALETSQFGAPAEFDFPAPPPGKEIEVFDSAVEKISPRDMIEMGEAAISRVMAGNPEVLYDLWASKRVISVRLVNSRGLDASYRKSVFVMGLEGVLVRGTDMLFVGDVEASCHPLKGVDEVVETVKWQLDHARRQATVPSKSLPVVFTPRGVAGVLLPSLFLAFNGRIVLQGASPLEKKVGEHVFDRRLSFTDDATIPYQPASRPFDDEGVASRPTPLVSEGVVRGFLHDLQTAARAKCASTGNGSRMAGGLPTPFPTAFIVNDGTVSLENMVGDIKEGLLVEHLMGAEQGNLLSGDFSGNVLLGYKIENGEVVGRVKDAMLSGNAYETLKNLVAVGSKGEWVGGAVRTPPLCCSGLSLSAR